MLKIMFCFALTLVAQVIFIFSIKKLGIGDGNFATHVAITLPFANILLMVAGLILHKKEMLKSYFIVLPIVSFIISIMAVSEIAKSDEYFDILIDLSFLIPVIYVPFVLYFSFSKLFYKKTNRSDFLNLK